MAETDTGGGRGEGVVLPVEEPEASAAAGKRKKRKRERKRERREVEKGHVGEGRVEAAATATAGGEGEMEGLATDPLVVFGSDLLTKILGFLDARSVARSVLVSRGWQKVASSDRLWKSKCEELWKEKAHIPRSSMVRGASKLEAYSLSMMDGKRSRIMKEDLCDHVWEFRFKKTAPAYWLNLDPSWKGTGPPMCRYFHPNGSQTADPSDEVWGGHECKYSIVTSFVDGGHIREHYVRINRWPRMSVSRKQDWSWEMANDLYCYSSIPDADKEGGTGPVFPFW